MAKKKSVKKKQVSKKINKKLQAKSKVNFNAMAIAGFVLSFLNWFAILGIVLCAVALMQIKKSNQRGRKLAIAGIVIGILVTYGTVTGLLHF